MAGILDWLKQNVGLPLLIVGVFYFLFPHEYHISSGLGLGLPHPAHQALGMFLIILGAYKVKKPGGF